jgi:hypothetical protein
MADGAADYGVSVVEVDVALMCALAARTVAARIQAVVLDPPTSSVQHD